MCNPQKQFKVKIFGTVKTIRSNFNWKHYRTKIMELLGPKRLTEVFKFSHILNILPYYGFLHEWKILMEKLSTQTNKVWTDNLEVFVKWGENYKTEIWICINTARLESFMLNFDFNYKFISNFVAELDWFEECIPILVDALSSNKMIFMYGHSNPRSEFWVWKRKKYYKYINYKYKLFIYSEEEASAIIPAINWPNFKNRPFDLLNEEQDK